MSGVLNDLNFEIFSLNSIEYESDQTSTYPDAININSHNNELFAKNKRLIDEVCMSIKAITQTPIHMADTEVLCFNLKAINSENTLTTKSCLNSISVENVIKNGLLNGHSISQFQILQINKCLNRMVRIAFESKRNDTEVQNVLAFCIGLSAVSLIGFEKFKKFRKQTRNYILKSVKYIFLGAGDEKVLPELSGLRKKIAFKSNEFFNILKSEILCQYNLKKGGESVFPNLENAISNFITNTQPIAIRNYLSGIYPYMTPATLKRLEEVAESNPGLIETGLKYLLKPQFKMSLEDQADLVITSLLELKCRFEFLATIGVHVFNANPKIDSEMIHQYKSNGVNQELEYFIFQCLSITGNYNHILTEFYQYIKNNKPKFKFNKDFYEIFLSYRVYTNTPKNLCQMVMDSDPLTGVDNSKTYKNYLKVIEFLIKSEDIELDLNRVFNRVLNEWNKTCLAHKCSYSDLIEQHDDLNSFINLLDSHNPIMLKINTIINHVAVYRLATIINQIEQSNVKIKAPLTHEELSRIYLKKDYREILTEQNMDLILRGGAVCVELESDRSHLALFLLNSSTESYGLHQISGDPNQAVVMAAYTTNVKLNSI